MNCDECRRLTLAMGLLPIVLLVVSGVLALAAGWPASP